MRRDKCQVRCKESSHLPNAQFLWRFTTYERQSLWPRPRSRVSLMDDQAVARTLTRAVATAEAAQMEAAPMVTVRESEPAWRVCGA